MKKVLSVLLSLLTVVSVLFLAPVDTFAASQPSPKAVVTIKKDSITVNLKNLKGLKYDKCTVYQRAKSYTGKVKAKKSSLKKGQTKYVVKDSNIGKYYYTIDFEFLLKNESVAYASADCTSAKVLMKGVKPNKKKSKTIKIINVRPHEDNKKKKVYVHWTETLTAKDKKILSDFAKKHFKKGWSDYDKLNYTFNWIQRKVTYCPDKKYPKLYKYSYVERIFKKKSGQCIDYNGAMANMMAYLGYRTRLVEGYSYGNNHYWGQIRLHGHWMNFDVQLSDTFWLSPNKYSKEY